MNYAERVTKSKLQAQTGLLLELAELQPHDCMFYAKLERPTPLAFS